jgi:Glycosyl transferases group 1
MACGAPVLTTRRTSLPEVGGEAVAYTEPDAESIQVALRALIDDPERRAALGVLGYTRAQEFTWAASAAAHLASYKRAADQQAGTRAGLGPRGREACAGPRWQIPVSNATGSNPPGVAALAGRVSMLRESAAPPGDCP